jgi:hypothetical protein
MVVGGWDGTDPPHAALTTMIDARAAASHPERPLDDAIPDSPSSGLRRWRDVRVVEPVPLSTRGVYASPASGLDAGQRTPLPAFVRSTSPGRFRISLRDLRIPAASNAHTV